MKKIISFVGVIVVMFLMSSTAFAGDVPEELLSNDQAQVFFGEVISYESNDEISSIEVIPTKKIKGDVIVDGSCATWQNVNPVGNFDVDVGEQYLFTWSDINNPICVFEVTGFDTETLKLKNITGDMWERFEEYLNDGKYEKAEVERAERLGLMNKLIEDADTTIPEETSTANIAKIFVVIIVAVFVTAFAVGVIFIKKKRR